VYRDADVRVIFGAILDDKKGGAFQISTDADRVRHKQFYGPSTNVLVTRFLFKEGIAEREDFLPVGLRQPHLV
jgi:GH15 family glucan-1,4-alpha-glucosidase